MTIIGNGKWYCKMLDRWENYLSFFYISYLEVQTENVIEELKPQYSQLALKHEVQLNKSVCSAGALGR